MSTVRPKANPHAGLPGGRHGWRFHLSVLLLIIPISAGPRFFRDEALFFGDSGLGQRELGMKAVGPWHVSVAEYTADAPIDQGLAGHMKTFAIRWSPEDADRIKASYFRIGKPRSLRAAGVVLSGSPYRQTVDVPIPERAVPDDELWLTVEGWDGAVHQTAIPLAEASPATVAWLKERGEMR
ncbi:thiamine pyrophosphate-binding protein [Shinella pollutisoli]|uniref:Thiamine pyrophosphate-binding protein n=1 Tax=Shinella pollutisoli TaxID=2250594 RepID=A0ABV7DLH8_9HYPH|nr:thiamine pyrophosphate-binding protein [Shinella pollutisoli]